MKSKAKFTKILTSDYFGNTIDIIGIAGSIKHQSYAIFENGWVQTEDKSGKDIITKIDGELFVDWRGKRRFDCASYKSGLIITYDLDKSWGHNTKKYITKENGNAFIKKALKGEIYICEDVVQFVDEKTGKESFYDLNGKKISLSKAKEICEYEPEWEEF